MTVGQEGQRSFCEDKLRMQQYLPSTYSSLTLTCMLTTFKYLFTYGIIIKAHY